MEQLFEVNMLKVSLSAPAMRLLSLYLSRSMIPVPGKKSPRAGITKVYGKISAHVWAPIQNGPPVCGYATFLPGESMRRTGR